MDIIRIWESISPIGVILAIIPPIIWLSLFIFFGDRQKPEPKYITIRVFVAGALGAIIFVIIGLYIRPIMAQFADLHSPFLIFIFAALEEAVKFASVYLAVRWSKFLDEPVDRMIYMVTGAMGFAAIENILINSTTNDPVQEMAIRMFGAVLIHALVSSMVGFYWAQRLTGNGLLAAGALHGLFNIIVMPGSPIHGLWFTFIIGLFIIADFDIIKNKWKTNTIFRK